MRLVSAIWPEFHPFENLGVFDSCVCAKEPQELQHGDVLIIHGGADISPVLYNKGLSSRGHGAWPTPDRRDQMEWALMQRAKELNIPLIGICRGAQMLCALEGGHLIQHINNHSGSHTVFTNDGAQFETNSIHHQQLVPKGDFKLVAWTPTRSREYWDVEGTKDVMYQANPLGVDPEFIYYPNIKGFAIQWHPEMMSLKSPANQYVLQFVENHV